MSFSALPPPQTVHSQWRRVLPGIGLCAGLAAAAVALHAIPGLSVLSVLILAIVLGMALHNLVGTPDWAKPGAAFSVRWILRGAIVLLGLQLTVQQLVQAGLSSLLIVAASVAASFLFTKALGRLLGVAPQLADLIAAGTAVCGASAVVAIDSITHAPDEDVAYAVACVTAFGGMAMFIYPALYPLLHLAPRAYGLWAGSSIHEIAQVVAAAFQHGAAAGHIATIAKLARISMLAPLVLMVGLLRAGKGGRRGGPLPVPLFVLGFIAMAALNSMVAIAPPLHGDINRLTGFLLALSLAAMGLHTDIRRLVARGLRPLALGAAAWLFIAGFSLGLIEFFT